MTDHGGTPAVDSHDQVLLKALSAFRKPSVAEMAWKRISKKVTKSETISGQTSVTPGRHPHAPLARMTSFPAAVIDEVVILSNFLQPMLTGSQFVLLFLSRFQNRNRNLLVPL